MIENMSEDERKRLVTELQNAGYIQKPLYRQKDAFVTRDAFASLKVDYNDCSKLIYGIADLCTDNFYRRMNCNGMIYSYRNRGVPEDKQEKYAEVCDAVMEVIKKYASNEEQETKKE